MLEMQRNSQLLIDITSFLHEFITNTTFTIYHPQHNISTINFLKKMTFFFLIIRLIKSEKNIHAYQRLPKLLFVVLVSLVMYLKIIA